MEERDEADAGHEPRLLEAVGELSQVCDELVRLATALHAIGDAGRLAGPVGRALNRHVAGASTTAEELDQVASRAEARALAHLVALARLEIQMLEEVPGGPVTGYGDFTTVYAQGTSLDALRDLVRRPRAATPAAQAYVDDGYDVVAPMLRRLIREAEEDGSLDVAEAIAAGDVMPEISLLHELRELIVALRDARSAVAG